jgi:hypothetical protein
MTGVRRQLFAFLIGLLLVPLLLVSAGPGLARAVAGAAPHVCRCDAAHTDCVCTLCHPDGDEHAARPLVKGVCGDQDLAFGAWHVAGVLPRAPDTLVRPPVSAFAVTDLAPARGRAHSSIEPPPPRA